MKITDLPDDQMVRIYIELRDRRAVRKAAFENEDAGDKSKQEKIESVLMERFIKSGTNSIGTDFGTAYKASRTSATVADKEVYLSWVREQDAWDFLDIKANKTSIVAFKDEHNDLPPGINWREESTINVRRS